VAGLDRLRAGGEPTLEAGEGPARLVTGVSASAELFEVLGVHAALGRAFQPGEDLPGADRTAVLSHGLWQEMGGDASILGRPASARRGTPASCPCAAAGIAGGSRSRGGRTSPSPNSLGEQS